MRWSVLLMSNAVLETELESLHQLIRPKLMAKKHLEPEAIGFYAKTVLAHFVTLLLEGGQSINPSFGLITFFCL